MLKQKKYKKRREKITLQVIANESEKSVLSEELFPNALFWIYRFIQRSKALLLRQILRSTLRMTWGKYKNIPLV